MSELEALETFGNLWMGYSTVKETYPKHYATIEKALKALEIIKEKNVIIEYLKDCNDVEDYNSDYYTENLTKDEFNILKEGLNNG